MILKCGDCLELMKELPDKSVDLVVTSPPYNKGYWSSNRNLNNGFKTKSRRIEYGTYNDCIDPKEYELWQIKVLNECLRVIKDDGSIFYNMVDILNLHQTIYPLWIWNFPIKQVIVWNRKNTPKLDKSYFFPITENIFWIMKNKKSRVYFNRREADFKTNVWEIPPDARNKFPAPFPVSLPLNCIKTCCPIGGVVLDPFMGSGTTGVACKRLGRNFIGYDIHHDFVEMAKNRIEEDK